MPEKKISLPFMASQHRFYSFAHLFAKLPWPRDSEMTFAIF